MKRFFWYVLKKLPIILAVLMAPVTIFVVLHYRPDFKSLLKLPASAPALAESAGGRAAGASEPDSFRSAEPPPVPGVDWQARAEGCTTAGEFAELGREALNAGETTRARTCFLEAVRLDPRHAEAHLALGDVLFDPAEHLDGYSAFEPETIESELSLFRDLKGEWLTDAVLVRIRNRWQETRERLALRVQPAGRVEPSGNPPGAPGETPGSPAESEKPGEPDITGQPDVTGGPDRTGEPDRSGASGRAGEPGRGGAPGEKAPFFTRDEILALVAPGVDAAVFRAVCHFLVAREGLCGAEQALMRRMGATGGTAEGSGFEEDWQRLCSAADFDAAGEADRIGYALCHLIRADGAALRRELDLVDDGNPDKIRLMDLYPVYEEAAVGSAFLAALSGEADAGPAEAVEEIGRLLRRLEGAELLRVLSRARLEAVLSHLLLRMYLHEETFLRSTYRGLREADPASGIVRFAYDFSDRNERLDFDAAEPPLADDLAGRLGAAKVPAPRAFQIRDGSFACYGRGFAALDPVFTGPVEAALTLRFEPRRDRDFQEPYYVYFGYGLGAEEGYVASCCLKGLDVNGVLAEGASGPCAGNLRPDHPYTVTLTGDSLEITHEFNSAVSHCDGNGIRTGRIFIWASGPRWFVLDSLEVRARIDEEWLRGRIAPLVEKDLRKLLK